MESTDPDEEEEEPKSVTPPPSVTPPVPSRVEEVPKSSETTSETTSKPPPSSKSGGKLFCLYGWTALALLVSVFIGVNYLGLIIKTFITYTVHMVNLVIDNAFCLHYV